MSELIAALLVWIGTSTPYDTARLDRPEIRFAADICSEVGLESRCRIGGYYDHHTQTVVLRRSWDAASRVDRGLLLHELVHHAQAAAGALDFDSPLDRCRGEMEAFALMARWLAENGERARLDVRRATREACAAHFAAGRAE